MFFVKLVKFYRISIVQKKAGQLLPISSNIWEILLARLAINQFSRSLLGPPLGAIRKQFTMFVSKIFKITKVEGNNFCGWVWRNKKGYLAKAATQRCFAKKRSERFGKPHRKTPVQETFFSLYAWNVTKKQTPA